MEITKMCINKGIIQSYKTFPSITMVNFHQKTVQQREIIAI